jgi:NADPH:quinone reductase-like Zn-dependent oxidoreductase
MAVSIFKIPTGLDVSYDDANSFGFKPSNVSFSEAAAVLLAGLTALQALRRGGAGGVGSLAIQIAKTMLGASHVVCTTASVGAETELRPRLGRKSRSKQRSSGLGAPRANA